MEEMQVQDVEFLHGCTNPTLIVIHQDVNGRHIKTHEINMRDKEFMKIAWKQDNVETEATMLIPVPSPLGKPNKSSVLCRACCHGNMAINAYHGQRRIEA